MFRSRNFTFPHTALCLICDNQTESGEPHFQAARNKIAGVNCSCAVRKKQGGIRGTSECKTRLRHLLVTTPTTVASPTICVPKINVIDAVHSPFQMRGSFDGDFCPRIIAWLPVAINSLQNYESHHSGGWERIINLFFSISLVSHDMFLVLGAHPGAISDEVSLSAYIRNY